ncbi:hypothetical protein H6F75_26030 [Nodosilinea sp. FACHB-131]|uniref:hypothetical protein n=1 Tax=Cyanophyceae TaxID=3028117 RepID=UPI0016886BB9|nr:hypothetical protein [Nodosilinea sp. FACHB-131]MBD1876948.1 hypothetical protein [Nodosilinea sp. FACHB-131]
MQLPDDLLLKAEEIRYLRPIQLSVLTKMQADYFSAWSATRSMSEASLTAIAEALGIDREEVLRGFDLRREDYVLAQAAQKKAARLLTYLQLEKESA